MTDNNVEDGYHETGEMVNEMYIYKSRPSWIGIVKKEFT